MKATPCLLLFLLLLVGCAPATLHPPVRQGEKPVAFSAPTVPQGLLLTQAAQEAAPSHRALRPLDAFERHLAFLRAKQAALSPPGRSEREDRIARQALARTWMRVLSAKEDSLRAVSPERLYERGWLEAATEEREAESLSAARDAKQEEYWRWALHLTDDLPPRFERVGPGYLATEPPLRESSRDTLVRAVLAWGDEHRNDPLYLQRSPSEVALFLLAERSALRNLVLLGHLAHGHLDYTPSLDKTLYTPEQWVAELLVGFIPGVGEVVFALEAATGISLTGHQLEDEDRIVTGLCVLVPFAPAVLARGGATLSAGLERMALLTGRSLEEVQVLSRLAAHLSPADVAEVERILAGLSKGQRVSPAEVERLNAMAKGMKGPLLQLAEAVLRGGPGKAVFSRLGADAAPLAIGSAEHLAQCWLEYQFRHQARFTHFSFAVDSQWERLYRTILANASQGGEFERAVLASRGLEKNRSLLIPPPGQSLTGFMPDAVKGAPHELVWGQPYHFIEVKGRADMALTGNLEAMIEYVTRYGGHLEVWFRSAKHAEGATRLTGSLKKRLKQLKELGQLTVKDFPE